MKPRRRNKHDRLTSPGASQSEIRCDMAVAPLDRTVRTLDVKWGIGRLPELVSTTTAEKYGFAAARLNEAIDAADPEQSKAWAEVCIRGLAAMDAEATAAGHEPADPRIWQYEYGGLKFGIIADGAEWKAAKQKQPDLVIYSMQQVAAALVERANSLPAVQAIKQHFPQAEMTGWRQYLNDGGDPIPPLDHADEQTF